MRFRDRADAGRRLATRLEHLKGENPVVLALPRGGVPVGFEVAVALGAPLDVIVVRKLGVPFQQELGMGAIGEDGVRIVNDDIVRIAGVTEAEIDAVEQRERAELERRLTRYRGGRKRVPVEGRTVIVVDDGIATGSTARAACRVARLHGAARVVLAVPVGARSSLRAARADADDVVCFEIPSELYAIGEWYDDFSQTSDEEVVELLGLASGGGEVAPVRGAQVDGEAAFAGDVTIELGRLTLFGRLEIPAGARGVVVFAHGSGSSRFSPRNRYVAQVLEDGGLGTLLFDLLTPDEELDRANVFDVGLLAQRLAGVTAWLAGQPAAAGLPVGYFGASTGAAAALWAAAEPDSRVTAVVSRGGRPDLAGPRLAAVRAPTLLIVGGYDDVVLELNEEALARLTCESRLEVVPGATHLFEEPGTLAVAAGLARAWFEKHL